jgi:hypothetical protein
MRKASGKEPKGKKKTTKVKDLTVKDAKAVKGGKEKYMVYKMSDIIITS